ncbi:MAG: hypothetical protein JJU15_14905 [Pararhodobacter sp.]|nr:hypothetical protein [Pararhodobacter sp.]
MQIILHIGAHKTASTHLQHGLARARPALQAQGVAVFGPDQLRRRGLGLPEYLSAAEEDPDHGARLRAAFAQPCERLVLSDENILGSAHNVELIRTARFYDRAAHRLERLAALLPPGRLMLALGIRNPAGFLASAYVQRLMSGRLERFEDYAQALDPARLQWSELVARVRTVLPDAAWSVWRYEDYPGNAPAVLQTLLGPAHARVPLGDGVAHPGLSAKAHDILMREAPELEGQGEDAIRERVKALRAAWPKGPGQPGVQPLDAEALRRADAAYACDCAQLAGVCGLQAHWQ